MQYWDDMHDKYGFQDGEAIPDGIEAYRTVYVRYVNAQLARLGSQVRVVAYNRPGVHNYILIRAITAAEFGALSVAQVEGGEAEPSWVYQEGPPLDDAYHEAVEEALQNDLDSYITVQTSISDELQAILEPLS